MLVGKPVQHTRFGAGKIVAADADTVSVNFAGARGRGVTRKFLRAALFDDENFPKAQNPEVWATRGK